MSDEKPTPNNKLDEPHSKFELVFRQVWNSWSECEINFNN